MTPSAGRHLRGISARTNPGQRSYIGERAGRVDNAGAGGRMGPVFTGEMLDLLLCK